ncbi:MAG: small ribosomal subunit biogenesis GTPase RsgA [Scytolyngbya sp. HA4215-MV1]|jgi:ribosome biogenesis GTPase|nr:small ribosomal subunit biogenesis GTPase RsgA [Scytolyngbya sp. HA4215-MV1]
MSSELENQLKAYPSDSGKFAAESHHLGTVLAAQANFYSVSLDIEKKGGYWESGARHCGAQIVNSEDSIASISAPELLLCTRRSRLKKIGQQVMVGDRVQVEEIDWHDRQGVIVQVLPRQSELDRPPVANADQILLVFALTEPTIDPHQLSRFLVKAESTGLKVCLCFSKCDLVSEQEQTDWCDRLSTWGYHPLPISVPTEMGLATLQERLNQKISIVSGPSGVGKSSLINYLIPNLNLRTGAVSGKLGRGRHTTRHVELFALPHGGLLADTPGFNQPELDCAPEELATYFPEIREKLAIGHCQFSNCSHREEPNCLVRGDWERYEQYLSLFEEIIGHQDCRDKSRNIEPALKLKSKREGQEQYEPKLESKKYRRTSRRSQQQALQAWYQDGAVKEE